MKQGKEVGKHVVFIFFTMFIRVACGENSQQVAFCV